MSEQTQAVLYNAVPLFFLAALYGVVTAALVPAFLRERSRLRDVDFATALMFPCVGIAAAITAVLVIVDGAPVAGHPFAFLAAIVVAALPAVAFIARWKQRGSALSGATHAREAEAQRSARERELDAVSRLSLALTGAGDEETAARLLVEEACEVLDVAIGSLAVLDEEGQTAHFVAALKEGVPLDWLVGHTMDLRAEPSGVASAAATGEAFTVVDAVSSPRVSRTLVERLGMRSAAFVPLRTPDGVSGVLVAGSTSPRSFTLEEVEVLQALAGEGALALERLRSAAALRDALGRERLIARIGAEMRSALDLDAVLAVAVRELGAALDLSRCLVRLDQPLAEWTAEGLPPVGESARLLPVTNLAQATGRTIAVADVETTDELAPPDRAVLLELESRAALATPIVVDGETIGALALHRREPRAWAPEAIALAEAVAREAGQAIRTARLLEENRRRLAEQSALLDAGQALASELTFDAVIARIVDELTRLLGADAADCWIFEEDSHRLRCRAVRGLPETEVGRTIPVEGTLATAIESGRPVLKRRFAETEQPPPSANFAVFAEVMDAPIVAGGETRGVLGVCSLEHDRFDQDDLRLLDAFARLAGIALRNAEAFDESTRRAQVQQGFFRIASVLGEPLSAVATLDAVAQAAAEALGGDAALLLRPVGDRLELAGSYELRPELVPLLDVGVDSLELAAAEHRVLAAPSLEDDGRFGAWQEALTAADARSLLAVPVEEARGQRGGLVIVFFTEERVFSDDDLELARQVATAARGALERSEVYEVERRARALAQHLASTGRTLTTELDPAVVLDEIPRQVTRLLEAQGASVRLLEGDELVLHGAVGPGSTGVLGARSASTASLAGHIVQSREPATIVDIQADERHADADPLLAPGGYRAYVGVPMIAPDGSVYGVLSALSSRRRDWRSEEVDALQALAGNAATALTNAELYQRVALDKGQSEAILANVADGIVAVDRDGAVVLWNAAAERITGVPATEALGRPPEQVARSGPLGGGDVGARPAGGGPARHRGRLALDHRGGHDRSCRRGRGADLRVQGHLRGARRRADEVRVRLGGLARAAHTVDVDLRVRRDPAPRGRAVRRRGAAHVPSLHRVRVGAADDDRRHAAVGGAPRGRRRPTPPRADRRGLGRLGDAASGRDEPRRQRAPLRRGAAGRAARRGGRSRQAATGALDPARQRRALLARRRAGRRRGQAGAGRARSRCASRTKGSASPPRSRSTSFASSIAATWAPGTSARAAPASGSSSPRDSSPPWAAASGSTRLRDGARRSRSSCPAPRLKPCWQG